MAANPVAEKPAYHHYPAWLSKEHGVTVDARLRNRYETVAATIQRTFEASDMWQATLDGLAEFDAEYQVAQGFRLLDPAARPALLIKPFGSVVEKTYRRNILDNPAWPDPPPRTGWILPIEGLTHIPDVVRTTFVVKYLDGVSFLVEQLEALAAAHEHAFKADFEAKEEGYYAAHAYVTREFEVPAEQWDTVRLAVSIELQVTTQVQELIKRLLHTYYEEHRRTSPPSTGKWQWNYRSDEFAANYLGHILHYVEGMIMEIRDRQKSGGSDA